ncbi:MAG: helix-turn-helix domain-containing protein [Bacteroidota bacterium]
MNAKELGNTFRLRRKSRKISQKDLAEISSIGQRTLRDIEKGIANPELATLLKISEVLGMELSINIIT